MNPRRVPQTDLSRVFGKVTKTLKENRESLNSADEFNHNHGDNMVDTFQVIAQAMREKKASSPSEQLSYAGQQVGQKAQSGSAKLYSQGLVQAAERVKGQSGITPENAMMIVQALMGGQTSTASGQSQGGMGDLLGTLMGGGQTPASPDQPDMGNLLGSLLDGQPSASQSQSGMGDLLGSLLGGQAPAAQAAPVQANQPASSGIDLNTLLTAGMAFLQARQQGAAPVEAIVQAVMAGSQMNSSTHRAQSGQMVAGTLLNTLSSILGGAK